MKSLSAAVAVMAALAILFVGTAGSLGAQEGASLSGKVVETMDSGGYSYALIEKGGKKTWVAVPQTKITKGKTVTFQPGMEMVNFESKTLKKKFDKIYFSGGIVK
ncbi:MAG: hypothetical protein AB1805_09570 [Nitrospirota bacterium]